MQGIHSIKYVLPECLSYNLWMLHYILGQRDICALLHKYPEQHLLCYSQRDDNKNVLKIYKVEVKLSVFERQALSKLNEQHKQ